jgi:hypothetical protein
MMNTTGTTLQYRTPFKENTDEIPKTEINGKMAFIISKRDMEAIRGKILLNSLKAKAARPVAYRELRKALYEAVSSKILIDQYYPLAKKITGFLKELLEVTPGTIFYHPYKEINPDIYGSPQEFTKRINALFKDMEALDEMSPLKLVK